MPRKQVLFIGQNKIVSKLYEVLWAPQYMWGGAYIPNLSVPGGREQYFFVWFNWVLEA